MPEPWITEPGRYDLTAAQYHADPVVGHSLSNSGAKLLLPPNCPAIFKANRDGDLDQHKPEFDFGTAAHKRVLGAGEEIVVVDAEDWRTKAARETRDEAYARGATPILARDEVTIAAMATALRRHPIAAALLDPSTGSPEQTLVWRDERTGVMRRALVDWLRHPVDGQPYVLVDYKTAARLDTDSIEKALFSYGYYGQGAWYGDGVTTLGIAENVAFLLIMQMKTPPYLVVVAQPDPDAILRGRHRNARALDTYARCVETDTWPGYADDQVISISLPGWATYQLDLEEGLAS